MTDLLDRPTRPNRPVVPLALVGARTVLGGGALAAVWSAGLALLALTSLMFAGGTLGATSSDGLGRAARSGALAWLSAHHVRFAVSGGAVSMAPLGLTLLLALGLERSAGAMARRSGVRTARDAVLLVAAMTAAYATAGGLVAGLAGTPALHPSIAGAVLGPALLAAAAGALGVCRSTRRTADLLDRLGPEVRPALAAGATAVAGLLVVGALLAGASLAVHLGRAATLSRLVAPDGVGAAALLVMQVPLVPNAAVWAAALAAGPGFAVGTATGVSLGGATLGPVPSVPLLAALPAGRIPAAVAVLAGAGPVIAGMLAASVLRRQQLAGAGPAQVVRLAAAAAGVAGTAMGLLSALSGGAAGPGRLAAVGPSPWRIASATAVEIFVVAGVTTVLLRRRDGRSATGAPGRLTGAVRSAVGSLRRSLGMG